MKDKVFAVVETHTGKFAYLSGGTLMLGRFPKAKATFDGRGGADTFCVKLLEALKDGARHSDALLQDYQGILARGKGHVEEWAFEHAKKEVFRHQMMLANYNFQVVEISFKLLP